MREKLVPGDGVRPQTESAVHKAIRKVGDDIEGLKFNTAIAAMMTLVNEADRGGRSHPGGIPHPADPAQPLRPHMTEELWELCGFGGQLSQTSWPVYDESKCREETVEIAVQINGKVRSRVTVAADADAAAAIAAAKADEKSPPALEGMALVKELYVPGKLVNLVIRPQ